MGPNILHGHPKEGTHTELLWVQVTYLGILLQSFCIPAFPSEFPHNRASELKGFE